MGYQYIIIGGGFFGCYIAIELKQRYQGSVVIIEREADLLKRASYNNQARAHKGYHYPRSLLTGLSSRINFQKFIRDFKDCIYDEFEQYYALGKLQSKVTAFQFKAFCQRIGAPVYPASSAVKSLFNKELVEDVFLVEECAFDPIKLKNILARRIKELNIPVLFNTEALGVQAKENGDFPLQVRARQRLTNQEIDLYGKRVFNCTYSNINTILANSGIAKINLKQELTELALVEVPEQFKHKGITLMCGPFFSLMPFPPRNLHSFSHVRYTPHHYWYDQKVEINNQDYFDAVGKRTNISRMLQDAKRYIPSLAECKYIDSLWELKTVLPQSETDDSRPIFFKRDVGMKNLICVMGGKLDNVYDLKKDIE